MPISCEHMPEWYNYLSVDDGAKVTDALADGMDVSVNVKYGTDGRVRGANFVEAIPLESGKGVKKVNETKEVKRGYTINHVKYHRNGIGGEPFYAVHFTLNDPDEGQYNGNLVGILTDGAGSCFVVKPDNPEHGYRGDNMEPELRNAVVEFYAKTYNMTRKKAREELNDGLAKKVY